MNIVLDRKKLSNLKERAAKRQLLYPSNKNLEDVQIENSYFEDIKQKIYKQITEEK